MNDKKEAARLRALKDYHVLDTPAENEFNKLVELASYICGTPISLVSLVDETRQWFKARVGLEPQETAREQAFCAHAIQGGELMIVPDARQDKRFADNPLVTGNPNIRFYAGIPLINSENHALGTLCVIDKIPRQLSSQQKDALRTLADQVMAQLELRRRNIQLEQKYAEVNAQKAEIDALLHVRNELINELQVSNELKDRIFMLIGHDLRNPLNNLRMVLEMSESKKEAFAELAPYLTMLRQSLSGASQTLENLLAWGLAQHNKSILKLEKIAVRPLLEELASSLTLELLEKGNSLSIELPENLQLTADAFGLRTILLNLLTNANKFSQQSTIIVEAKNHQAHQQCILVKDTGIGIPAAQLERLFSWEKKSSQRGTANEMGSGVGLLMSRDLAELMQGSLQLSSQEGNGTTVHLCLPKA